MARERLMQLDEVAARIHSGQVDKQGAPYIDHVRRVAAAVSNEAKPVALMHDAIEDRRIAEDELRGLLTNDEFAAVRALTRDKRRENYCDFIVRIDQCGGRAGMLAREVKIADVRDNLDRLTPELERLRPRYEWALARLATRQPPALTRLANSTRPSPASPTR